MFPKRAASFQKSGMEQARKQRQQKRWTSSKATRRETLLRRRNELSSARKDKKSDLISKTKSFLLRAESNSLPFCNHLRELHQIVFSSLLTESLVDIILKSNVLQKVMPYAREPSRPCPVQATEYALLAVQIIYKLLCWNRANVLGTFGVMDAIFECSQWCASTQVSKACLGAMREICMSPKLGTKLIDNGLIALIVTKSSFWCLDIVPHAVAALRALVRVAQQSQWSLLASIPLYVTRVLDACWNKKLQLEACRAQRQAYLAHMEQMRQKVQTELEEEDTRMQQSEPDRMEIDGHPEEQQVQQKTRLLQIQQVQQQLQQMQHMQQAQQKQVQQLRRMETNVLQLESDTLALLSEATSWHLSMCDNEEFLQRLAGVKMPRESGANRNAAQNGANTQTLIDYLFALLRKEVVAVEAEMDALERTRREEFCSGIFNILNEFAARDNDDIVRIILVPQFFDLVRSFMLHSIHLQSCLMPLIRNIMIDVYFYVFYDFLFFFCCHVLL